MKSNVMTNRTARQRFASLISAHDRVLVTGATGWFGRTVLDLLTSTGSAVHATASATRRLQVRGASLEVRSWKWSEIEDFRPTVVFDCAFLTRDRLDSMLLEDYIRINEELTANVIAAAALESVSRTISISSGAAVYPVDAIKEDVEANPYGWLKRRAEVGLLEVTGGGVVVARAWSVSGSYVQKPRNYAFSDMVLQASTGLIRITANKRVYRRYVSVEDLLALSLSAASVGSRIIDSGGELVEMAELAESIRGVVNPRAAIERPPLDDSDENLYFSDGESWEEACSEFGYRSASLEEQIRAVRDALV